MNKLMITIAGIIIALLGLLSNTTTSAGVEITHTVERFYCNTRAVVEGRTNMCSLELSVKITDHPSVSDFLARWPKIACFGEIGYKSERYASGKQGFLRAYEYIIYRDALPNFDLDLDISIYLPFDKVVLDPKVRWVRCDLIEWEESNKLP